MVILFAERSFCREDNSFAVTVVGHGTTILFLKILAFSTCAGVFIRTSTNFAHLTSFQAIEFMDWPVPKRWTFLYVRQVKTKLSKRSILKNENTS